MSKILNDIYLKGSKIKDIIKNVFDNILKDHYKIKADFALMCVFKVLIVILIIKMSHFHNFGAEFATGCVAVFMAVFFTILFRNSIILFFALYIIFRILIDFFGYYFDFINGLNIYNSKIDIINATKKQLILFLLIWNIERWLKNNIAKPVVFLKDHFIVEHSYIVLLISMFAFFILSFFGKNQITAYIICFIINFYLAIHTANIQLKSIDNKYKYKSRILEIINNIDSIKERPSILFDYFKSDLLYGAKLVPAIFLYSTLLSYDKWTSYFISIFFIDPDSIWLNTFKYLYIIS